MTTTRIDLEDGKYSVVHDNGRDLRALRNGEPWRDLVGDKLIFAMTCEIEQLRARLDEVHSWIVCAAIASPADMMQNAPRIIDVTDRTKAYES